MSVREFESNQFDDVSEEEAACYVKIIINKTTGVTILRIGYINMSAESCIDILRKNINDDSIADSLNKDDGINKMSLN